MKRSAQNLIEFVFIIPLLLVILFGIVEFAVYFRNVSVVQDIATEAAIVASRRFVVESGPNIMDSSVIGDARFNSAAQAAMDLVISRRGSLAVSSLTFNYIDLGATLGSRPNTFYRLESVQTRNINGVAVPLVTLLVDYRNPMEEGLSVQLIYQYRTLLLGVEFPVVGGAPIVILPRDMPITSRKVRQYITY